MAQAKNNDIVPLVELALELARDKAYEDALLAVKAAQREYLEAEAKARREKTSAVILAINKLDIAKCQLEQEYRRIQPKLTREAQARFDKLFAALSRQRKGLVQKKNHPSPIPGPVPVTLSAVTQKQNHGIRLAPGDILATGRIDGLYQHFGVYIGNDKVIHYAAERSDFGGRITIHEAPLSDFCADSEQIYVLDFPDDRGYPTMRTWQGDFAVPDPSEEGPLFRLIRETSYHLYTPEETVTRAKSRIGEENYNLVVNNCEHFAIWCKTGISESHQVNVWLTRLFQYAEQYILN